MGPFSALKVQSVDMDHVYTLKNPERLLLIRDQHTKERFVQKVFTSLMRVVLNLSTSKGAPSVFRDNNVPLCS